jgi:hypothetical protein
LWYTVHPNAAMRNQGSVSLCPGRNDNKNL